LGFQNEKLVSLKLRDDCLIFAAQLIKIKSQKESVLKVNFMVILNLFQDLFAPDGRPRNKFGVTGAASFVTFQLFL